MEPMMATLCEVAVAVGLDVAKWTGKGKRREIGHGVMTQEMQHYSPLIEGQIIYLCIAANKKGEYILLSHPFSFDFP
jgi:hypothetical protein